jgi:hypothetical protein
LEIELNDQERRAVGRLLMERKALLIETTEDTTQPDAERRAGLIEFSVIESNTRKATTPRCHVARCFGQEARGGMSRKPFPLHISLVDGFRGVLDGANT